MGGDSRDGSEIEEGTILDRFLTNKKEESSEFVYEEIIENAMRFLNKSLYESEKMTLREYSYEMHAYHLKEVDKEKDIHWLAWQINQAKSTVQKGKKTEPYFKNFKQFFDYEKKINRLNGVEEKSIQFSKLLNKANS